MFTSVISFITVLLLNAYGGSEFFRVWSFRADDGWCPTHLEDSTGFGVHCFGDLGILFYTLSEENPWLSFMGRDDAHVPIPPTNLLFFQLVAAPAFWIGSYKVAIVSWLAVFGLAMLPLLWQLANNKDRKAGLILLTPIVSFPIFFSVDRGNIVFLLFPLLYYAFSFLIQGRYWGFAFMVLLAGLVKPQFAALIVVLLLAGKWAPALLTLIGVIIGNLIALYALGFPVMSSFQAWIAQLLNYTTYQSLGEPWPQNISAARGFYFLTDLALSSLGLSNLEGLVAPVMSGLASILVVLTSALLLLISLRYRQSNFHLFLVSMALSSLIAILPSVSFGYYGIVFVVSLVLIWRNRQLVLEAANPYERGVVNVLLVSGLFGTVKIPIGVYEGALVFSNDLSSLTLVLGLSCIVLFHLFQTSIALYKIGGVKYSQSSSADGLDRHAYRTSSD